MRPSGKKVLAYDLGGTKVAAGIVNDRGKVLAELREPVAVAQGKKAVIDQLASLGKKLLKEYPGVRRAGIASAGPLDPQKGLLIDPTNYVSAEGSWGITPITKLLSAKLKIPFVLENDAAASMLAEHWLGAAKRFDNAMILTLGTGLGTGVIANGRLVRAGQHLHTEAGHIILKADDSSAPCGCGNLGCGEAFLSGRSFSRRARVRFARADLNAKDITDLARQGDPRALAAFDEYAHLMAIALHNFAVIYAPQIVVFTGSFAAAADLFMVKTSAELERMLVRRRAGVDVMPKLAVSTLANQAGLIGGAYVAFHPGSERKSR